MYLYAVADKISKKFYEVFISDTDAAAIRAALPSLCRSRPLNDIEIVRVCEVSVNFDSNSSDFGFTLGELNYGLVSKDSYTFDEVTASELNKTDALREIELIKKAREIELQKLEQKYDEMLNDPKNHN